MPSEPERIIRRDLVFEDAPVLSQLYAISRYPLRLTPGSPLMLSPDYSLRLTPGSPLLRYHRTCFIDQSHPGSNRMTPHRTASHRIAPHRTTPHRIASHRVASSITAFVSQHDVSTTVSSADTSDGQMAARAIRALGARPPARANRALTGAGRPPEQAAQRLINWSRISLTVRMLRDEQNRTNGITCGGCVGSSAYRTPRSNQRRSRG